MGGSSSESKACLPAVHDVPEGHKEIKRALRKKTQAKEDSNAQAEEEEEKESS
jgi:hypothetical protein